MTNGQWPVNDQCSMSNEVRERQIGGSSMQSIGERQWELVIGIWSFTGHWSLGHWSLLLGHSLDIGHYLAVVIRLAQRHWSSAAALVRPWARWLRPGGARP